MGPQDKPGMTARSSNVWVGVSPAKAAEKTAGACRDARRPFVLGIRTRRRPEPPDEPHHHRLQGLARPRPGPGARHARPLGARRGGPALRRAPADVRGDETAGAPGAAP